MGTTKLFIITTEYFGIIYNKECIKKETNKEKKAIGLDFVPVGKNELYIDEGNVD